MGKPRIFEDQGHFRRRFPRRALDKKVGVLCGGVYLVCETNEMGEGGMSIISDYVFNVGQFLVVTFQIPGGAFVSLRAVIKSVRQKDKWILHGISFILVPFSNRRQIRSFVSERVESRPQKTV